MEVDVAVLDSLSLISLMVSVNGKPHDRTRPCQSCVEVEVAVLGSPSLISLMVSVDVKQNLRRRRPGQISGAV